MQNKVLVSVCMITYNHEKYIMEAIEGVLKQKINGCIELIIGEDCSTDETYRICEEYVKRSLIKVKLLFTKKNLGIIPNLIRTLKECQGKYIALCEGDDYWTDPYKLQKQVDILETQPDYSLSVHNADILWETNKKKKKSFNDTTEKEIYNISDLIQLKWFIPTASMVFRKSSLEFPNWINYVQQGDFALALCLALKGNIHYINEHMSVYRKNPTSLGSMTSDTKSEFRKLELLSYFDNYTNFVYHESILKRKQSVYKNIYYQYLKNSGRYKKYLNIDYLIFKLKYLQIKLFNEQK